MGSLRKFKCEACGYAGDARIGSDMANHDTVQFHPAICRSCRSVKSVNLKDAVLACQTCGSTDLVQYGVETKPAVGRTITKVLSKFRDTASPFSEGAELKGRHLCPRCESFSLQFSYALMRFD